MDERNVQMIRRIKGNRLVRVEITEDGDVYVSGARAIEGIFFCRESEHGLEVVAPENEEAHEFRAVLTTEGVCQSLEAILYADKHSQSIFPAGSPSYSLSLSKEKGEAWKIDARDGQGDWYERHIFSPRSRDGRVITNGECSVRK